MGIDNYFLEPDLATNEHGSGLGLFICKQNIEAHGGEISALSLQGEGTTINIKLPEL